MPAATGLATAWNPSANDSTSTLVASGNTVYAAGTFNRIGAQTRRGLAALDAAGVDSTTGIVTAWDPDPFPGSIPGFRDPQGRPIQSFGPVRALTVSGTTVYAGGRFDAMGGVGGQTRRNIAALDAATGVATAWDPGIMLPPPGLPIGPYVSTLAVSGSAVYVGGLFGAIGGQPRNSVAALYAATGLATVWDPSAIDAVNTLLVDGATVYVGGSFRVIGGLPRRSIAAMGDLSTPTLISLVSADADPDRVRIVWYAEDRPLTATVYRRTTASAWNVLGQIACDGTGRLVCEDTQLGAENRYGYRLGVVHLGAEQFLGETWVDIPRASEFTLSGQRPNPATTDITVAFSLPDASPARLELLDVAGRTLAAREVGPLGRGGHVMHLAQGHSLAPGVYLLRLTQRGRSLTARAVVISSRRP